MQPLAIVSVITRVPGVRVSCTVISNVTDRQRLPTKYLSHACIRRVWYSTEALFAHAYE
jgi:hypothetical protein